MVASPRGPSSLTAFVLTHFIIETQTQPLQPIAPQRALQWKDVNKADLPKTLPLVCGTAPLPTALRGIFWLSHQGASSVLVSFGGANNDGGNLNLGYLDGPELAVNIRLEGERTFTTVAPSILDRIVAYFVDGAYSFRFNDAVYPTYGQIYVRFLKPFDITFKTPGWLSNYSMTLLGPQSQYPGSVVWERDTSMLSIDLGETYLLVQVINENFTAIEPAFSKMLEYENDVNNVGALAGDMFYRSIYPSPTAEAEQLAKDVDASMGWKWALFWLLLTLAICYLCPLCCGLCWYCCCKSSKGNARTMRSRSEDSDYYEDDYDYYDDYYED